MVRIPANRVVADEHAMDAEIAHELRDFRMVAPGQAVAGQEAVATGRWSAAVTGS